MLHRRTAKESPRPAGGAIRMPISQVTGIRPLLRTSCQNAAEIENTTCADEIAEPFFVEAKFGFR